MKPNQHYTKILKTLPVLLLLCMGLKSYGQVKIGENETQFSPSGIRFIKASPSPKKEGFYRNSAPLRPIFF